MDFPFHSISTFHSVQRASEETKCIEQSLWMWIMLWFTGIKILLSNVFPIKCIWFWLLCIWWSRWEITQWGGSPPLALSIANEHAPFNHLHVFIIHLPQAMNYSALLFPHENSERWHEVWLFPILTCSSPSSSVSLSRAAVSLWQCGDKDGEKSPDQSACSTFSFVWM